MAGNGGAAEREGGRGGGRADNYTWDIGSPGESGAFWSYSDDPPLNVDINKRRLAHPPRDPVSEEFGAPNTGFAIYPGAQLVTVVIGDADGAQLYIDGAKVPRNALKPADEDNNVADVRLPLPRKTLSGRGCYVPLVFSTLVVGSATPPAEVTVKFKQEGVVIESASMHPNLDTQVAASCYLFPYPVQQVVHRVSTWCGKEKNKNNRGEDLGYLSVALIRIRKALRKIASAPNAEAAPIEEDGVTTSTLDKSLRAYASQNLGLVKTDPNSITDQGAFGPNPYLYLKPDQPDSEGQANSSRWGLLEFKESKPVEAQIVVEISGYGSWTLVGAEDPTISQYFQGRRALLEGLLGPNQGGPDPNQGVPDRNSIQGVAIAAMLSEKGEGLGRVSGVFDRMYAQVMGALTGTETKARPSVTQAVPSSLGLWRTHGPALVRKPTRAEPLLTETNNALLDDELPHVTEARAAFREAESALGHDFDMAQRANRGPMRVVQHFKKNWESDYEAVYRPDLEIPNVFVTSGVPPLGVEMCTGAFLRTGALTEAQVRERIGGGQASDAQSRLGLEHTPEAQAALVAFADLVVHECLTKPPSWRVEDDPIDTVVRRAQQHATFAAQLLSGMLGTTELYGTDERKEPLFFERTDPLFVTSAGGRAALICVRHLPCWAVASGRTTPGKKRSWDRTGPLWSRACCKSAAAFAKALMQLGKSDHPPVHPIMLPLLPLQALWSWPPTRAAGDHLRARGTPLLQRQRDIANTSAARAGDDSLTTRNAQEHSARLSAARALHFLRTFNAILHRGEDPNQEVVRMQERLVFDQALLARPAAVRIDEHEQDPYSAERVAKLLDASGASTSHPLPIASIETMDSLWAGRAVNAYSRWRRDYKKTDDSSDILKELAKLSLLRNDAVPGARSFPVVQEFYVPYGSSIGTSPLSGNNSAVSEWRVWTSAMYRTPAPSRNDSTAFTLKLKPCAPHDAVLYPVSQRYEPEDRTHPTNPYVFTLNCRDGTLDVPVSLTTPNDEFADSIEMFARCDRVRCIAFTAERLYQALLCASAREDVHVTLDMEALRPASAGGAGGLNAEIPYSVATRLAASVALALGMLPGTCSTQFIIDWKGETERFIQVQNLCNELARALTRPGQVLHTLALGEAAAAMAAATAAAFG